MNGYIICNNDSTEFIVIGNQEQANAKLKELKDEARAKCRRDYGTLKGDVIFDQHFWHIHDCDFVMFHPAPVALLERIRNHQNP